MVLTLKKRIARLLANERGDHDELGDGRSAVIGEARQQARTLPPG